MLHSSGPQRPRPSAGHAGRQEIPSDHRHRRHPGAAFLAAYSDTLAGLPPGFTPLSAQELPITLGAGESFAGGVYRNQNAAAAVTEAVLDGKTSLVVAFRGSDDGLDSQSDLNGINRDFPLFANLVQAVDAAAASGITSRWWLPATASAAPLPSSTCRRTRTSRAG
ncbi:hypothetical protein ACFQU2_20260 [Siccirubricoccus deserti]